MTPFHTALGILILLMAISLVICFIRLFIGPSLPNRTVAFDTIAVHAAGIIVLFAMLDEARALLSVAPRYQRPRLLGNDDHGRAT